MSKINVQDIAEMLDASKKMNIKGKVENRIVFRIPLDILYYNDQNGRVATEISKYESEYGKVSDNNREEYNRVLEKAIINSNKKAFEKTKNGIMSLGQLEPGVVFSDGRVIDGNRRFTCLRKLYEETGKTEFAYFEAVILDEDTSEKDIKLIELELQHGKEDKVDYNPIDKLVDIYRDVVENELIGIKEYANSVALKESEVKKMVELSELMVEFLDYIKAPKQFYIARDLEIDGPLNEIYSIKKKLSNDYEAWENAKIVLFDNLLLKSKGDITRGIRELKNHVIFNEEIFEEYINEHENYSIQLHDKLKKSNGHVDTEFIRKEIREDETLKNSVSNHNERVVRNVQKEIARNEPVELLRDVNDDLSKMDYTALNKLTNDIKNEFQKELDNMKAIIHKIESSIDEII